MDLTIHPFLLSFLPKTTIFYLEEKTLTCLFLMQRYAESGKRETFE